MRIVVTGCAAFLLLYLFDCLKLAGYARFAGPFFFCGFSVLLGCSLMAALRGEAAFVLPFLLRIFCLALTLLCFLFLLSALFFVLPFGRVYLKPKRNAVINTGLYALCRHPGVLFFFLMYGFLWLFTGRMTVLWACLAWTAMDVLHVWVQDRFFFPRSIDGYREYQNATPFLIPDAQSAGRCLADLRRERRNR